MLFIIDACIVTAAVTLAYFLRFDFQIRPNFFALLPYVIIIHLVIVLPALHIVKFYKRVWQYASIGELVAVLKAVTVSELLFAILHTALQMGFPDFIVPRAVYILTWALMLLGIGGSRFVWRIFRDNYFKIQPHQQRMLIVGAGSAGALVARDLKHSPDSMFYPVVFVDDDPAKQSLEILGLPIVGSCEEIPEVVNRYNISMIIIAMPSVSKQRVAEIIDLCKSTKASIKILPGVSDFINGKASVKSLRDVDVEDLLGREPVKVDMAGIADYVSDEIVLVTGAGGSIGSELCRQIAPFQPKELLLLGHGENSIYDIELELRKKYSGLNIKTIIADIQDVQRIEQVFSLYRPSVVFHAAAHKHVPLMERNPAEAVKNNILGTKHVATCAHEYGASRFVLISTDKAVNPTSIMGATKRVAEMIVQSLDKISDTTFAAVRFGNVLGSRGSVIPVFKQQIKEGGPVTVTHPDMVRYFMTIPEAVQLVIQAGALANGGEIFILDMGKPVKIADLARDLIRLSGLEPGKDIQIAFTGIRPGEKLFEEILTEEEGTSTTKHDRIYVGKPADFSMDKLFGTLNELERMAHIQNTSSQEQAIRELLESIVPTFQWNRDYSEAVDEKSGGHHKVVASRTAKWAANNG